MSILGDLVMAASVAVGNAASRERDRAMETVHEDGRPKALGERAKQRWDAIAREGVGKVIVAETAHFGARELGRRLSNETARRIFRELGKRPIASATAALFAFDTARDGWRLARGDIDRREFAERVGGNGAGLVGSAGGAWVGSMVGTLAMPVVGTMVGSVVGGVVGGIGGDTWGRAKVRDLVGDDDDDDDDLDDDDFDDDAQP
jgi:hypothetical protein